MKQGRFVNGETDKKLAPQGRTLSGITYVPLDDVMPEMGMLDRPGVTLPFSEENIAEARANAAEYFAPAEGRKDDRPSEPLRGPSAAKRSDSEGPTE